MTYSWDAEIAGAIKSSQNASVSYATEFMRAYVKQPTNNYAPVPKVDDYLSRSLREGIDTKLTDRSNASYKTGTYDIASKLGLYNPTDSVSIGYSGKRNSYQKDY